MDQSYLKKRVTIYQVAKEAGYSLATVSRVINNKDNVTKSTREKVLKTMEKLGFTPSAIAQGLAKSKTTNIGIIVPNTFHMYISLMLAGMIDIAKIYGFNTSLFTTTQNRMEVEEVINSVIASNVDGVVIFDDQLTEQDIDKFVNYGTPVSVIGKKISKKNVASVSLEYEDSIRQIISEHFSNNNTSIKFLHIPHSSKMMDYLEALCRSICDSLNKGDLFEVIPVYDSYSKTYEQFKEYFTQNRLGGLFIAPRDTISCGVNNAANDLNLNVPNDVEIVSIIGTKYSTIVRPQLTTLEIDMYEVGSIAMRMLTKLLNNTLNIKCYPFYSIVEYRHSTKK